MTGDIKIDFQVYDSGDPDILMIMDFSNWALIESQPAVIQITVPGSIKPIMFNFEKGQINAYNSTNLGTSCTAGCGEGEVSSLPDGIYEIKLEGSPNTYFKKRYYLKTDKTRLELDKIIFKLGLNFEQELVEEKIKGIQLIDFLLMAAKSSTKLGEISYASSHFKEVLRLIEKEKNCISC